MNNSVQLFGGALSVITKPIPKVSNPLDVVVRVSYSGVCGTDLHILSGEFPASQKAVVLGHEFCGIVHAIGDKVTNVCVDDKVVINPNDNCHICSYCSDGHPHFCKIGGIRSTVGIWKNGGWANYCKVTSALVYKLPDDIPLKKAALIEPFSCIARGWENLGNIKPSANILICGAGIIGLLWTSLLHFNGHRNLTVSELSEPRRNVMDNLQLNVNAVHPDDLEEKHQEAVRNSNEDWGFDVIIDCTGVPRAIEQSFNWLRKGATFLIFGCCPKEGKVAFNPFQIYYKELKIVGSMINPNTFRDAIAMVRNMNSYLEYNKLGIETFQLHEYQTAIDSLKSGEIAKAVFEVDTEKM